MKVIAEAIGVPYLAVKNKLRNLRHPEHNRRRYGIYQAPRQIAFEQDMIDRVNRSAKRDGVTFGAKIREYVEWGLESELLE